MLQGLAKLLAILGGVILTALALMTVVSIIGRALIFLGLGPVPGDFELVEQGVGVAIFWFLPWCMLQRGHVTVDILFDRFPRGVQAVLTLIGNLILAAIAIVIARQLWLGLSEKLAYGDTTWILGIPIWYGYSLAMVGAALFVVTALWVVFMDLRAVIGGARA